MKMFPTQPVGQVFTHFHLHFFFFFFNHFIITVVTLLSPVYAGYLIKTPQIKNIQSAHSPVYQIITFLCFLALLISDTFPDEQDATLLLLSEKKTHYAYHCSPDILCQVKMFCRNHTSQELHYFLLHIFHPFYVFYIYCQKTFMSKETNPTILVVQLFPHGIIIFAQ